MDWFDKACDALGDDLANGLITEKEYHQQMREVAAELKGQAEDAAEQAYNDIAGYW